MHDSLLRIPEDRQAVKPCRRRFLDEFKRDAVWLITDAAEVGSEKVSVGKGVRMSFLDSRVVGRVGWVAHLVSEVGSRLFLWTHGAGAFLGASTA